MTADMDTMQWTTIDKSDWADGPWQDEPDKVRWADETTGLPCLAVRNRLGAWCGYAGVPKDHPWFNADPFSIDLPDGVHGGLNFATFCQDTGDESHGICHVPGPGEPDHVYWLGFDCGHARDISPATDALCREHGLPPMSGIVDDSVYRDLTYVQDQCRHLARQIHEAGQ